MSAVNKLQTVELHRSSFCGSASFGPWAEKALYLAFKCVFSTNVYLFIKCVVAVCSVGVFFSDVSQPKIMRSWAA